MSITPLQKTEVLLEAIPWLRAYRGSIIVVKYGGSAMINEDLRQAFVRDILFLYEVGLKPVVVHGGGPQINEMLKRLNMEAPFIGGYRVTTPEVMEIVRMVLTGKVQRELVGMLNLNEAVAVGISGEDAGLFQAVMRKPTDERNLGLVGDITQVNPGSVLNMLERHQIPVISSVAPDITDPENVLNVNADAAAAALAVALKAKKMLILTDVEGLYMDYPDPNSLIQKIRASDLQALLPTLVSGMIPKVNACLDAISGGVKRATIIDGRLAHSMLLEIVTDEGTGTEIMSDEDSEAGQIVMSRAAKPKLTD